MKKILLLIASAFTIASCAAASDDTNSPNQSWQEICFAISTYSEQTTYEDVVKQLGKPFDEYPTPSLPTEYVLFFPVPDEPKYMHWIMLHTDSNQFFYAGRAQQLRKQHRFGGDPPPVRQCDVLR